MLNKKFNTASNGSILEAFSCCEEFLGNTKIHLLPLKLPASLHWIPLRLPIQQSGQSMPHTFQMFFAIDKYFESKECAEKRFHQFPNDSLRPIINDHYYYLPTLSFIPPSMLFFINQTLWIHYFIPQIILLPLFLLKFRRRYFHDPCLPILEI